ncbi:MAG: HNH endonuclease signature motif containing protein [Pseudomonadota bacterium]
MAEHKPLPSRRLLCRLFDYDPETGNLLWRARPRWMFKTNRSWRGWNARYAGKPAGVDTYSGHRMITILDRKFWGHRIAYKIVHGCDPQLVDHIDGNPRNNAIANLRSVTKKQNARNNGRSHRNWSGAVGVSWSVPLKKWRAYIKADGHFHSLGNYRLFEDALAARQQGERRFGFSASGSRISNYTKPEDAQ